MVATIFSSLSFLSNSFSSPRFNVLRVARRCFSWSSASDYLSYSSSFFVLLLVLSFSHIILSLSFLCSSVSEALFALSFSFLSERSISSFFFVHAKAAQECSIEMNNTGVTSLFYLAKTDFEHAREIRPHILAYIFFKQTYRHTYQYITQKTITSK